MHHPSVIRLDIYRRRRLILTSGSLAYHEMRLILAKVLWHFDLSLCDESADWADQKVYMLWEKKPLMVRLAAREGR